MTHRSIAGISDRPATSIGATRKHSGGESYESPSDSDFGEIADNPDAHTSAGGAWGEREQEGRELVSCVARQTGLVDERECDIHDLLAGVLARVVFGELTEPAEFLCETLDGDLGLRCRVRMGELRRGHPPHFSVGARYMKRALGRGLGRVRWPSSVS